jgi:peptide/nickel transport system substrate-binding protein
MNGSERPLIAVALALAVALAACAPSAPSNRSSKPAESAAAKPVAQATDVPLVPTVGAVQASGAAYSPGGTTQRRHPEETPLAPIEELRIALGTDVSTLSPFFAAIFWDKSILKHIAPSLTRVDENTALVPMLAESWSLVRDDTWQFKLRRGVKFHNGEPFTAEAIKVNVDVMLSPETRASQASTFRVIQDVQIVDDYTVNLVTTYPNPVLPRTMSDFHIVAPKYLLEHGHQHVATRPVGTGPYKFVEWVKDSHLIIEANPDYWGGPPAIKRMRIRPIKEDGARVAALLAGEVDWIWNVPYEMARQIDSSGRAVSRAVATARVYVLGMSTLSPEWPTAKKEVRQAISHAIDRESLNRNIMAGYGLPLATLFHINAFGVNRDLKPRAYDPEKAKQLLAQAGYPNGFTIRMLGTQGRYPKDRELAQAIVGQLGQVGITVDLQVLEFANFLDELWNHKHPMGLWSWGDSIGDPNSMMIRMNTCGDVWSQNCLPELDALAKAQQFELDPQKRGEILKRAQDVMYEEEPNAALFQIGQVWGVSPKMQDWYEPRADESFWFYFPVKQ